MSIIDIIKKSVLEQFTNTISVEAMVLSLVTAFLIAMFIIVVYRKTFCGIVYNRSLILCIVMLAMVTAMIIRTINSNLALSLGMVGALSIVRFRTAIKEPIDTAFMFWAITAGIMSGAGLYLVSIIGSAVLGLLFYITYITSAKSKLQYLLVVLYDSSADARVNAIIDKIEKKKLKSKSANSKQTMEVTYEVHSVKADAVVNELQNTEGVKRVSLITYQNEVGL
ncbi:MAG: DUF4956 domain-containing protein [Erysipelotrichaceae bacterium]|nr:DUF4956 domain-containing protein [Erysipelotrichaceae bacterium]